MLNDTVECHLIVGVFAKEILIKETRSSENAFKAAFNFDVEKFHWNKLKAIYFHETSTIS